MPNINIEISAPLGGEVVDPHVRYPTGIGAQRVTEVPSGAEFEIWAGAQNLNASENTWEILYTATDGETIYQWKSQDIYGGSNESNSLQELERQLDGQYGNPVMPNHDITLSITLWGNGTRGQPLPPLDQW